MMLVVFVLINFGYRLCRIQFGIFQEELSVSSLQNTGNLISTQKTGHERN